MRHERLSVVDDLDRIFKIVAEVVGQIAGALARRRLRIETVRDWSAKLRKASDALETWEP